LFVTFRFASGLPYSRLKNFQNGQTAPFVDFGLTAERDGPINSATMPWIKNFDLRFNKGVRVGPVDATVFADFRNLFNFRNVVELFAETGDVANEGYRDTKFLEPEMSTLRNTASASGKLIQIKDAAGELMDAVDLRGSCSTWASSGGAVDCLLLRRAETRFGNNDGVYDANEQKVAITSRYNLFNGEQTKLGQPRHIRVGFELNF
jgi:hypothetical protein